MALKSMACRACSPATAPGQARCANKPGCSSRCSPGWRLCMRIKWKRTRSPRPWCSTGCVGAPMSMFSHASATSRQQRKSPIHPPNKHNRSNPPIKHQQDLERHLHHRWFHRHCQMGQHLHQRYCGQFIIVAGQSIAASPPSRPWAGHSQPAARLKRKGGRVFEDERKTPGPPS